MKMGGFFLFISYELGLVRLYFEFENGFGSERGWGETE